MCVMMLHSTEKDVNQVKKRLTGLLLCSIVYCGDVSCAQRRMKLRGVRLALNHLHRTVSSKPLTGCFSCLQHGQEHPMFRTSHCLTLVFSFPCHTRQTDFKYCYILEFIVWIIVHFIGRIFTSKKIQLRFWVASVSRIHMRSVIQFNFSKLSFFG